MDFALIIVAHWIGDYLLQTTAMATEKSYRLKWLGLHVLTYTTTLLAVSLLLFPWKFALLFAVLNGLLHGSVDFFTSRLSRKYQHRPRIFYPILGFDQMLHMLTLYLTYLYL